MFPTLSHLPSQTQNIWPKHLKGFIFNLFKVSVSMSIAKMSFCNYEELYEEEHL